MGLWYEETFKGTRLSLEVTDTFFSGKSEYQKVEIFETREYGRALAIDSVFMTSEGDEFVYHEMLTHPALLTAKDPKRVLVIGGGDGGTVREVLRHPGVEKCVMIEIDELVVRACQEHLPTIGTAWDDPRLDLRFADGIDYVKNSDEEPYDVILLDGTDPIGPGEVLFGMEFFRGVKRMLKPNGIMALQSETPMLLRDVFFETQFKLRELFGKVHPYFGPVPLYASGIWSWTWCSDTQDHTAVDEGRAAPIVDGCKYYNLDIHRGAFALPNYVRRGIAAGPQDKKEG
ncbi:MAG TPA: polyamine aminopropyltransferase [Polyangiaceae bacterium LLY-WYZ-15_(1-7)]|nr:spermidine synthase [Sandaracinus sp.]HJL03036.1 polyamine aminopropyltransferase [Polyangiaceae bacterium LLY-WYZ-15_(1-7)]HJL10232.1 polyamine aminopropyltransferase [Polyangiaceae bacterium LLY-WYZ-15_(1-7)]HJL20936.1 polyamine aminopropyltransferase [Polyangiaceae bacterium LLY-WYZ-15_(1-7)]HJL30891.1 polyamine aminopropyltransferase [Polyangiaceae bacterium LLY-WYZ-15_(1-7)]